jgi:hypothetical protein
MTTLASYTKSFLPPFHSHLVLPKVVVPAVTIAVLAADHEAPTQTMGVKSVEVAVTAQDKAGRTTAAVGAVIKVVGAVIEVVGAVMEVVGVLINIVRAVMEVVGAIEKLWRRSSRSQRNFSNSSDMKKHANLRARS